MRGHRVESDDGWTTVTSSGKRHGRRAPKFSNGSKRTVSSAIAVNVVDKKRAQRTVDAIQRHILLFDGPCKRMLTAIKEAVAPRCVQQIVCFGLGSMTASDSRNVHSRLQLALLIAMARTWDVAAPSLCAYDPVFTATDKRVLDTFGIATLEGNNEGKYPAREEEDGITLFYMPHCDKWLYSNLLWAN